MVAAQIIVSFVLAPGNGSRGDEGAGIDLVLMGQNEVLAHSKKPASIARGACQRLRRSGPMPLLDKALQAGVEGRRHCAQGRG